MKTQERLETAQTLLGDYALETNKPEEHRLDVWVAADKLVTAVKKLHGTEWGYLAAITGMDMGVEAGTIESLYQFCSGQAVVTLRVAVDRNDPQASLPTVCDVIPSASFFERELMEMFGVTVTGTPNSDRLFLPDNWPDGVYPLRKDVDPKAELAKAKGDA